jgi:hypothetical protein
MKIADQIREVIGELNRALLEMDEPIDNGVTQYDVTSSTAPDGIITVTLIPSPVSEEENPTKSPSETPETGTPTPETGAPTPEGSSTRKLPPAGAMEA